MKNNLTVIIPTYNNVKGLNYLLNYFKNKGYNLVVVDNKPDQDKAYLVHRVRKDFKDHKATVVYMPQKKNLGFAIAINHAIRYVDTKWMLILNDDIKFYDETTVRNLITTGERKKFSAVSPLLKNPNGKIENYGYTVLPFGKISLLQPRRFTDADGLTAACLLVRTDVFKKLKGFDEKFFAYLEDVDFFLRLKKMGRRLGEPTRFAMAEDLVVFHNHMTTSRTMGNFKARQDMINWWRLFFKHPYKFKFNFKFLVERLRNVSGYIKASLS